ncbi:MAG: sialidase family protein [bacterium]
MNSISGDSKSVRTGMSSSSVLLALTIVFSCALAFLAAHTAKCAEEPYFKTEPVFQFDAKRPSNHASSIAKMPNGDLFATWFAGEHEGMPDVAIWSARKPAGGEWSNPVVFIDDTKYAEGNALLFTDSKGVVWLFYVKKYDTKWDAWDKTYLYMQTSKDSGFTWTEPVKMVEEMGRMIRNNVTELPDGRLLLPIYLDTKPLQSLIWISGDGFKTWEERNVPFTTPSNLQPAFVWLGGEKLLMYARHNTVPGKIWTGRSDDLGKTWRDLKKTKLPNPDSGINMIKLKSGALVLAYNDSLLNRSPLCVAISDDEGMTWLKKKCIEKTPMEYSYPFMIQTDDGIIHLTYTADDRKIIKYAEFNEAWLRN